MSSVAAGADEHVEVIQHLSEARFTLGIPALVDGICFMSLAIGLFGFAEIIATLASPSALGRARRPVRADGAR